MHKYPSYIYIKIQIFILYICVKTYCHVGELVKKMSIKERRSSLNAKWK